MEKDKYHIDIIQDTCSFSDTFGTGFSSDGDCQFQFSSNSVQSCRLHDQQAVCAPTHDICVES